MYGYGPTHSTRPHLEGFGTLREAWEAHYRGYRDNRNYGVALFYERDDDTGELEVIGKVEIDSRYIPYWTDLRKRPLNAIMAQVVGAE